MNFQVLPGYEISQILKLLNLSELEHHKNQIHRMEELEYKMCNKQHVQIVTLNALE